MTIGWKNLSLAFVASAAVTGCIATEDGISPTGYGFSDTTSLPAERTTSRPPVATGTDYPEGSYIVEFRARTGPDIIGHSYIVFGRLGPDGAIIDSTQAGLYPSDVAGFAFGIAGTQATTEPVALDNAIPPSIVYRHQLTAAQYDRLSAAIAEARADPPTWSWLGYNCNTFVADMAREAGLQTPTGGTWMAPMLFVSQIMQLNGN